MGFGAGEDVLNGLQASGTFSYDAGQAPSDSDADPELGFYETTNDTSWMPQIRLSVEGVTLPIFPFPDSIVSEIETRRIFVDLDPTDEDLYFYSHLDCQGSGQERTRYYGWINLEGGSLPSDSIPLAADLSDFSGGFGEFASTKWLPSGEVEASAYAIFYLSSFTLSSEQPVIPDVVANGDFEDGLGGWTTQGNVTAVDLAGDTVARLTTASPAILSQLVNTPDIPFWLSFDYLFQQELGSLEVWLGGSLLDTLTWPGTTSDFTRYSRLVADPALLGLVDAKLLLSFDGPQGGLQLLMDDVDLSPVPEPSTFISWSLLGALGIAVGYFRRRSRAA